MIHRAKQLFRTRTGRLTLTYLAIIMALTLMFSLVIYAIASSEFNHQPPPHSGAGLFNGDINRQQIDELLSERAEHARTNLLFSLSLLNVATLLGGAVFSYFLARKTLEPIEAAMDAQSQFVSDASHELRTPLTALQVTNEVALRKKQLTLDEARELISYNIQETVKLRDLSEALLGLVRQGKADVNSAEINIQEVASDVLTTLIPIAQTKDITIEETIQPINIRANRSGLMQVLKVLLDNAIQYSPTGSTIFITSRESKHHITIRVIDKGPGIDTEHIHRIFERFYRIDQSRSRHQSNNNGLGLAIAKAVCDRQGYKIGVSSKLGEGSTFFVRIPQYNE